jgi:putative transposase
VQRKPPANSSASALCEVWTRDMAWMPGPVAGMFFCLDLILDIFSGMIVGWEVHERESAEQAVILIRQAVHADGRVARPLAVHADNGSPVKDITSSTPWCRGCSDLAKPGPPAMMPPARTGRVSWHSARAATCI